MQKGTQKRIVFVSYGLALIYGLGLLFQLQSWALSFMDPAALEKSPVFMNKFKSIAEFRT